MLKGVIFDFDGTITKPYLNFPLIKKEIGMPTDRLILEYMEEQDKSFREKAQLVLDKWEEKAANDAELNHGIIELLDYLKGKGIKTGILTRNRKRSISNVFKKFPQLSFDVIRTREEEPQKPDPASLHQLLKKLHLSPQEVLILGDYEHDIECGHNAGTLTMYLLNGGKMPDLSVKPDYTVSSIPEAHRIIQSLIEQKNFRESRGKQFERAISPIIRDLK